MSVYVSKFGEQWTVYHDDLDHTGDVSPTQITYILNPDGSHNHNFINVSCTQCNAVSTHPVGGGAQPPLVQEMFVRIAQMDGCACPADLPGGLPIELTTGHVKTHCEQMDGAGRWQVTI
jgi:hypothetical protein